MALKQSSNEGSRRDTAAPDMQPRHGDMLSQIAALGREHRKRQAERVERQIERALIELARLWSEPN